MKFFSVLSTILILACVGFGQRSGGQEADLKAFDVTESWQYPYKIADDKRRKLVDVLKDFKDPIDVVDLFGKLGKPDRIDDLSKPSKPLSHFETGFIDGSGGRYSFRCIWFARKASKSPGLSDSWLAAYVDKDGKTVSVVHSNYLGGGRDPGSSDGRGVGVPTDRGNGTGFGQSSPTYGPPTAGMRILSKPKANYTQVACRENFSGKVILRITFLASGEIGPVTIVKAAPYGMVEQSIAAAKRIKFEPAKVDGANITVTKQVEYTFDKCSL